MSDGSWAVVMLNRGSETQEISINWKQDLGLDWGKTPSAKSFCQALK
ncbi:glycoside hydrolase family 30 beta sandwich domain-containing protein [Pseudoalteromonas sp.]